MGKPRILLFDLEISANRAYVWGKYEQNVIAYDKEWEILSVAWKWNDEKSKVLSQRTVDEKKLVTHIHSLFNQADVIVAHNGNQFDIKKSKARFIYHGLPPTKRLSTVDTKLIAKSHFSFNSNSLDDLGQHLGLGRKVKHEGFDLWLKCMNGDRRAWKRMEFYNLGDVELLYRVYKKFLPWIQNHPSLAKLEDRAGCPNCGSSNVTKQGIRASHSGLRQQMRCSDCMGYYLTVYRR